MNEAMAESLGRCTHRQFARWRECPAETPLHHSYQNGFGEEPVMATDAYEAQKSLGDIHPGSHLGSKDS